MSESILPVFLQEFYSFWSYIQIFNQRRVYFVYDVTNYSSFILLHMVDQFSQHHLLKRLSFLHCIFLSPLSKTRCPQVQGFISGLSILFHRCIFLSLCQCHTVLMTVALQYSLKSGRLISPVPFFCLKIALAIRSYLYFHTKCEIICSSSVKNTIGSLIGIALNLQIDLDTILIFTILILPIHEHGIFLHLFVSSLISFTGVYTFLYIGLLFLQVDLFLYGFSCGHVWM